MESLFATNEARRKAWQDAVASREACQKAWQDAVALQDEYAELLKPYRGKRPTVVDYGCGRPGLSRVLLTGQLNDERDARLFLYDPIFTTEGPESFLPPFVITLLQIDDVRRIPGKVDVVNLTYVLCQFSPEEATLLLGQLRKWFPETALVVADYILKSRRKDEVLRLLKTGAELKWLDKLGEEKFVQIHTRYSLFDLFLLLHNSGWNVTNVRHFPSNHRAVMKAE